MRTGVPAPARRPALVAAGCAAAFAVLTALVVARSGAPYPLDEALHAWSVRHRPAVPAALARGLTATGSGPVPYLCALAAGLAAGRGTRGRPAAAAGALGFLLVAQGVRYGIMYAVARPRPPLPDWAVYASGYAYPSGHATTSALAAGLLTWGARCAAGPATARTGPAARGAARARARRAPWALPAVLALAACWAVAVGLSRVYLGVHWPTDVLGGWLYASTWLAAGAAVLAGRRGGAYGRYGPYGAG
ncbi:phosphatase PAP2 family protein [Streptomyces subrutilus]|uniref:phosphatase PAP2 family protein n=1 Tax=Streptomyces subrutilus TaxID=36818 RepID=UPI002E13E88B|nr:phosphatase PAP2 family protein [Streptomyces subrutilus]